MDLTLLEKLKEVLTESKDFESIFRYFLDHFGEDDAFFDLGKPQRDDELETLIGAVARQFLKTKCVLRDLMLIPIPGTKFIHGGCRINGRPANILYFQDIQVGLLALLPVGGSMTLYTRFSARELPPLAVPSDN